ncbi:NAD-dependent epimerase/dehydratase family protein, partial [Faecalicatena contorta]
MNILITGAKGFVGRNLTASLESIRDGKDRVHRIEGLGDPSELTIYTYDIDSTPEELDTYCKDADFVFNLAGVNRPKNQEDFMKGNFG